nr:bifunctional epoxide hydrolase 2-like [Tanacetum cinerariifolium]
KHFGGKVGYVFALLRPEKIEGVIALGAPGIFTALPEGFYIRRWQETGRAEADFGRLYAKTVVRNIYLFSKSEIPIASEKPRDHGFGRTINSSAILVHRGRSFGLWRFV